MEKINKFILTFLFLFLITNVSLAEQNWVENLPGPSSSEIIDCLKSSVGEKNLQKYFGSKKRQRPSKKHEGMMRKCFESAQKKRGSDEQQNQQSNSTDWTKNLPGPPTTPEIINCLKDSIGEKKLIKYFGSGKQQRPTPKDEKKLRICFEQASKQKKDKPEDRDHSESGQSKAMNMNCVPEGQKIERVNHETIIGVFGPSLWEWGRNNSFKDAKEIKKTGSNTMGIGLTLFIDKKGELAFGKDKAPQLEQYLCLVGSALKDANDNGLSTYLAIIPQILSGKKGVERSKLKGKQKEVFLRELENVLPIISKFAERHGVNYFAPLSEPEKRVGPKLAVSWMPKAAEISSVNFKGLLVWQTADDYYKGRLPKFSDRYDLFGIPILISGSNSSEINEYISVRKKEVSLLHKAVIASGISRFFSPEFGYIAKPNIKDETSTKIYNRFLNIIEPYTKDVLFLENPSDMKNGKPQQVNGTFVEEILKKISNNN